ncbi:ribonucleotide-diphosphate reductase subunit beta [Schumannella soli]|uniref:Ribonucleotide-diphosphate reductase subunit beta n=1 Tax=Schumannella soli TaxID=2590779 RepID=A0A506Y3T2_9MICO|nr:ribonucleotide-diphosphate reductase subunit beta [Schumannella soli]TPW75658.1 ribonucleotide-diphosphate reductase subunit beta [Schumannella soli]
MSAMSDSVFGGSTGTWDYEVPVDPMDELQCESCQ